jgi:hypothetical protein
VTEPTFETRADTRGTLVICTYDGETGAARVDSKGEQNARDRAEAQARGKAVERRASS